MNRQGKLVKRVSGAERDRTVTFKGSGDIVLPCTLFRAATNGIKGSFTTLVPLLKQLLMRPPVALVLSGDCRLPAECVIKAQFSQTVETFVKSFLS